MWAIGLTVLAALGAGGYVYWHLDDGIRRHVERMLASHYQQLSVEVGSARFQQGQGVFVNHLSLVEPRAGGQPQPILAIDELFLATDAPLNELVKDLLSRKPRFNRIVVRRPRLRAERQSDGRWNVAALVPLPKFSNDTPEMFIEDATLILEDAARRTTAPLSLRGVDLKLTPCAPAATSGAAPSRRLSVNGTATGAPARQLTFSGTLSLDDGGLDLTVDVRGLEVSPELAAAIPGPAPCQLDDVELYASADASVRITRAAGSPFRWSADVAVSRGRLAHPLLPQAATELAAAISADSDRLVVKQLTGKLGAADFALACNRQGWDAQAPVGLAGRVQGLLVDANLQAALPARLEQVWQRFRPSGTADAEVQLTFDGRRWRPVLTAHCRGMSLTDAKEFPYPLEQATGTVSLGPSPSTGLTQLKLDLIGRGNGRPVHITAEFEHLAVPKIPVGPTGGGGSIAFGEAEPDTEGIRLASATFPANDSPKPTGWVEVSGEGIPIHERLLAAIPPQQQPFVRSLRPQGLVDFRWRYERTDPYAPRGDKHLELRLVDCAVQYEKFPYPLEQVRGLVVGHNGHFTLTDLVGRDRQGAAEVACRGESQLTDAGLAVALDFRGTNVPLDDNLKSSLSPQVQQVWTDLRPQGRVNFVANVRRQPGQEKPAIRVEVEPHQQSVSIEPVFFPYRFEQVDGRAIVTDGRVELHQLRGVHSRTLFTANGLWQASSGGGWQLELNGLNADRLVFDPDLLRAVPLGVQKVVDRIRPTGNLNAYNSTLRFARGADSPQVASQWDLQLACHQASLRGDLPLDNLIGGIRLMGTSDGANVNSFGELAIDSLVWNDMQFTNLHGPFWSDSSVCYLGRQATARLAQPPRPITADVFGGTVTSDIVLQHANQPTYSAEILVGGVDLGRFMRERIGGPADLTGVVSGKLSLAGAGRSTYSLRGKGDLHVVDANIYRLPPLVAMLKVLRNRTPDSTAFDRCDMQFDLSGEHVHFEKINLLGDAVSLYGRGETNFDRRLNLVFYTLVGPADLPLPLWKTVAGHLSEQGLQLQVDGTWDNPQIHREAFPAVSQMLEQLRIEAEQGAAVVVPPASTAMPWAAAPR